MIRRYLTSLMLAVVTALAFAAPPALAVDPFDKIDCSGKAATSAVCQDKNDPDKNPLVGTDGLIMIVTRIIAVIAGIAAIVIIVLSGFRLVTGGGDANEVAGARKAIIYSIAGLLVIFLAQAIVGLVLRNI